LVLVSSPSQYKPSNEAGILPLQLSSQPLNVYKIHFNIFSVCVTKFINGLWSLSFPY
jgi:hypothetical protein